MTKQVWPFLPHLLAIGIVANNFRHCRIVSQQIQTEKDFGFWLMYSFFCCHFSTILCEQLCVIFGCLWCSNRILRYCQCSKFEFRFEGCFFCSCYKTFSPHILYFLFSSCLIKFGVRIFRVFYFTNLSFFPYFSVETFLFQNQSFSVYVSSLLLDFFPPPSQNANHVFLLLLVLAIESECIFLFVCLK